MGTPGGQSHDRAASPGVDPGVPGGIHGTQVGSARVGGGLHPLRNVLHIPRMESRSPYEHAVFCASKRLCGGAAQCAGLCADAGRTRGPARLDESAWAPPGGPGRFSRWMSTDGSFSPGLRTHGAAADAHTPHLPRSLCTATTCRCKTRAPSSGLNTVAIRSAAASYTTAIPVAGLKKPPCSRGGSVG
jgi:hypothetical protein